MVEVYGGRVEVCGRAGGVWKGCGGVWDGWRSVVRGVEVCGRGGGMWWKGRRNVVEGVEECCGKGVSCVVRVFLGRSEVCGWGGVDVGGGRVSCWWGR